jgi:hypothetical protein
MRLVQAKTCAEALQIIRDAPVDHSSMSQLMTDIITLEGDEFKQDMWDQNNGTNEGVRNWDLYEMKCAWLNKIYNNPDKMAQELIATVKTGKQDQLYMNNAMAIRTIEWLMKYQ